MSVLLDALKKAALEKQKRDSAGYSAEDDAPQSANESRNEGEPEISSSLSVVRDSAVEKSEELADLDLPQEQTSQNFDEKNSDLELEVSDEYPNENNEVATEEIDSQISHDLDKKGEEAQEPSSFISDDDEFLQESSPASTSDAADFEEPLEIIVDIDPELLDHNVHEDSEPTIQLEENAELGALEEQAPEMHTLEMEEQRFGDDSSENGSSENSDLEATTELDNDNDHVNDLLESVANQEATAAPAANQGMSDADLKELLSNVAIDDSLMSQIESETTNKEDQRKVSFRLMLEKNKKEQKKRKVAFFILFGIVVLIAVLIVVGYFWYVKSEGSQIQTIAPRTYADIGEQLPETQVDSSVGNPEANINSNSEDATAQEFEGSTRDSDEMENAATANSDSSSAPEKTSVENSPGGEANRQQARSSSNKSASVSENELKATQNDQNAIASSIVPNRWSYSKPSTKEVIVPSTNIITRGKNQDKPVSSHIDRGYVAYQQGNMSLAKQHYNAALTADPYHRDALLGAAAVAVANGNYQAAVKYYQRQLDREPQDDFAHAGLLSIASREGATPGLLSEVNILLQEKPSAAHLHFLKGALFAKQQRWPAAQEAFFRAWSIDSERADYTYNLAISLDHLRQYQEALRFYRQTLQLTNINISAEQLSRLHKRITQLEVLYE